MLRRTYPPEATAVVPAGIPAGEELYAAELPGRYRLLAILYRRRVAFLATLTVVVLLGMVYTLTQHPLYQSVATVLVTSTNSMTPENFGVLSDLEALTQNRSIETQVALLNSPTLQRKAYAKLSRENCIAGFGSLKCPTWAVKVTPEKDADIIDIAVQSFTSSAAAAFANSLAETYFEEDLAQIHTATAQARRYIETNRGEIGTELDRLNEELAQFKKASGLVDPEKQLSQLAEHIITLQSDLDNARVQVRANEQALAMLKSGLHASERTVIANTVTAGNPRFAAALSEIDSLQSERAKLLEEYRPTSPEIHEIDQRIAAAELRLKEISTTIVTAETRERNPLRDSYAQDYAAALANLSASKARVSALEATVKLWERRAQDMPEHEKQYTSLLQQRQLLQGTYDMLTQKYHNLVLGERTIPNGRVVSKAEAPIHTVMPGKLVSLILCLLLGLLCAAAVVGILERLDDRVHDQETAEALTGLPAQGCIPEVPPGMPVLVQAMGGYEPLREAFRILRNNLAYSTEGHSPQILAVTSFDANEGKSLVSANLAIATALAGRRVLIVDCDFYHQSGRAAKSRGLTDLLLGEATLAEVVRGTRMANLSFLPSGLPPSNPAEVLNSPQVDALLSQFREAYDTIVIDCPPCIRFGDVQMISRWADGMLLVTLDHRTTRRGLHAITRGLRRIGAPLLGIVINRVRDVRYDNYYPYYQHSTGAHTPSTGGMTTLIESTMLDDDREQAR